MLSLLTINLMRNPPLPFSQVKKLDSMRLNVLPKITKPVMGEPEFQCQLPSDNDSSSLFIVQIK